MLVVLIRSILLYVLVFLVIRLMGKRELAQMQPFELVILVMIADQASSPLSSNSMPIVNGVVSILGLLLVYIVFTFLIQSSNAVQKAICGTPIFLIKDGKINESELRKQQYTIEELLAQLRNKDIFKVTDVSFAVLETNGDLNVVKVTDNIKQIPYVVITDGKVSKDNLELLKIDQTYIDNILKKKKLKLEDILVGTLDENNQFIYQLKERKD
ncbi:MAG: DUF421 domain-containing protein [Clostridia bacterium]